MSLPLASESLLALMSDSLLVSRRSSVGESVHWSAQRGMRQRSVIVVRSACAQIEAVMSSQELMSSLNVFRSTLVTFNTRAYTMRKLFDARSYGDAGIYLIW